MTRTNLRVYVYNDVPEELPPSKKQTTIIDALDAHIEGFWTEDVRKLLQPVGHPNSRRFFLQQYKAAMLIKAAAAKQGVFAVSSADDWKIMGALRRVAKRRGFAPKDLLRIATAAE